MFSRVHSRCGPIISTNRRQSRTKSKALIPQQLGKRFPVHRDVQNAHPRLKLGAGSPPTDLAWLAGRSRAPAARPTTRQRESRIFSNWKALREKKAQLHLLRTLGETTSGALEYTFQAQCFNHSLPRHHDSNSTSNRYNFTIGNLVSYAKRNIALQSLHASASVGEATRHSETKHLPDPFTISSLNRLCLLEIKIFLERGASPTIPA